MMGTSPAAYQVGQSVEVLYDADAPMGARIDGFVGVWLPPAILMGVSTILFTIGVVGTAFPAW